MRKLLLLTTLAVILVLVPVVSAGSSSGGPQISVIIETARPYDALIATINSLGGSVTIKYDNVDAIAAQIPLDKWQQVASLDGVTSIGRDYLVSLPATPRSGLEPQMLDLEGLELIPQGKLEGSMGSLPDTYVGYLSGFTDAESAWVETGAGGAATVAVIDTGTDASHVGLAGRVLEGPDFSPDAGTPFEGSTLATNYWHGTFVAGLVASNLALVLPESHPLAVAISTHSPASIVPAPSPPFPPHFVAVPLLGIAPQSRIYAVKVFPHTGADVPISVVLQALDHVITAKLSGAVDIDVVNLSLGSPALWDGHEVDQKLVDAATRAGMTVVVSAGNRGPSPVSLESPAVAYTALSVAAAQDTPHDRIFSQFMFGPDVAAEISPIDEIRPVDFSARGPTADGRAGPDLIATGVWNFSLWPDQGLGWASGTSFSAPMVSGAAANLVSWAKANGVIATPEQVRNALVAGAVPLASEWTPQAQGAGYVNVPNALAVLEKPGNANRGLALSHVAKLQPNIAFNRQGTFETSVGPLKPGRTVDFVFEVDADTETVTIELTNVSVPPNSVPVPPMAANRIEFYVKSAKHTGAPYILDHINVFGDSTFVIGDETVSHSGDHTIDFLEDVRPTPMEPGLMKVTVGGWITNSAEVSTDIKITRVSTRKVPRGAPVRTIAKGEDGVFSVNIPDGTAQATFRLRWAHDWSKLPTSDLDMYFVSPSSFPYVAPIPGGATLDAPEKVVIPSPEPGTWFVVVFGYDVLTGRDPFVLTVELD